MSCDKYAQLAPEAFRKLSRAMEKLQYDVFLRKSSADVEHFMSLSVRQMTAMRSVKELNWKHKGGVTLKDLAKHIQITIPAASLLVDGMVKKGLLERKENPDDRRSICITLSQEGEEHFDRIRENLEQSFLHLMESFTDEECQLVLNASDLLYEKVYQND